MPHINILYDDNKDLLVLDKPVGTAVECPLEHGVPLWMLVQEHYDGYLNCHRIDKATSGLVIFASLPLRSYIMRNWHVISRKTYLAVIPNPPWDDQVCDLQVSTEKGPKDCITTFKVLQRNHAGLALVQCELTQNGRKHQIRQHLSFLGHPILGDLVYGGSPIRARRGQLLHAWKLSLSLRDGQYSFQAPIPDDFKRAFRTDWYQYDRDRSPVISSL